MVDVFRLPDIGEGLTEAEIIEWFVRVGDTVTADQPIVAVETDKTQVELPAPVTGTLLHQGAREGVVLAVGEILAVIGSVGETWADEQPAGPGQSAAPTRTADAPPQVDDGQRPIRALPLVRRRAREAGVDLAAIPPTGLDGTITRQDLDTYLTSAGTAVDRPPLVGTLVETAEDLSTAHTARPGDRTVRLSSTRRAIADHVGRSWREIPHVTTYDSFDATALIAMRRQTSTTLGRRVPLEALMIAAIIPALRAHPEFNATLDGDIVTLHDRIDMGVAIDGGDGLLVAVVRDAAKLPIATLAERIDALVSSARGRTLTREDATGATFTMSNIGAVGGGFGTPIIPWGTTAILSIGRATDTPVAIDGELRIAPMAPLSLSYDHRVIDGALGRAFLAIVKDRLTHPD